jgi:FkbM family methyltransferase
MTITSYAQNFEDVILFRALKHVKDGCYVDIGAQDPIGDSVSLAFYEQGWRGLHVEPTPYYAQRIREARPDEEVVEAAIASQAGTITFFEFPDTGLSTGDEIIARQHEAEGFKIRQTHVPCLPLSQILDSVDGREIHWLKIDVEGMEEQVIDSWSPSAARPWIVLVESTKPNSTEPSFEGWEPKLLALGYEFVYFDGLNRFYTSIEHKELRSAFGAGPNYFDHFVLTALSPFCFTLNAEMSQLRHEMSQLRHEMMQLRQQLLDRADEAARLQGALVAAQAEAAVQRAEFAQAASAWERTSAALTSDIAARQQIIASYETQIKTMKQELDAVYRSSSWRITAPLRSVVTLLKRLRSKKFQSDRGWPSSSSRLDSTDEGSLPARPSGSEIQSPPRANSGSETSPRSSAPAMSKLIVIDQLNTSAEAETVRRIYRQFTRARKQALENK